MKALHVVSNNAVVVRTEEGRKCVVTGKGLGFKKMKGDMINRQLIQNVFVEDERYKEHLIKQTK
ncbi:CAT RNA binding domain-containing protein [Marinilactibacillus kalidii]|uniref:CAT RNA binding domain-containing protein n=1 Tax=Marinilactibacillus kalidii TaxID=2820274 RepID=UPI001ABEBE1D|nr:CAT RNA binding domain-containing protein [Marinilactibacillus kalidii]